MGSEGESRPFLILFVLVALSLAIVVAGLVMRRQGKLRSPGAALVWAVLCIVPLFGAGFLLFGKHQIERATGETRSGHNEDPSKPGS